MSSIKQYKINVPDAGLADLKQRLSLAKFPDELDAAQWDMGAPLADIKRLSNYWLNSFDWRKEETKLNKLPHFSTTIQADGFEELNIHFLHKKSSVEGAVPLLFCHGWPGNFLEVTKLLEPLTNPPSGQVAFHVVAPSLPNFGFSEGPTKRGCALGQYGESLNKLMLKLGYNEYVTQGGDWGYYITRAISYLHPKHCKATHLNMDVGDPPSLFSNPILYLQSKLWPLTAREHQGRQRTSWFDYSGFGYNLLQRTKPQTLGYSLSDSPVGLLAWIYEKLHDWTDNYPWTDDEILTWVSIYWFSTAGPAASARIYHESENEAPGRPLKVTQAQLRQYIPMKIGLSHFPRDIHVLPSTWTRTTGIVVFEREHDRGGHFAAWEMPGSIVSDVREMFGRGGGAHGVVKGCSGY